MPEHREKTGAIVLDPKNAVIPLTLVASIVFAVAGGVVWINKTLTAIDIRLGSIEEKFDSKADQIRIENWALRLKLMNPEMNVPDPATGAEIQGH